MQIYEKFVSQKRLIAWLIDPDKIDTRLIEKYKNKIIHVDFIFLGGSIVFYHRIPEMINFLKTNLNLPVVLFPGSYFQVFREADAILFLNLISGRNPEYLISQQVLVAPLLEQTNIEVIPCSYILIDGGRVSSTAYITQTIPIPSDKIDLIVATALAGKYSGHKLIYLEAGSGAHHHVPFQVIREVSIRTKLPVIVGGGIRSLEVIDQIFDAGATCIVLGSVIENDPEFLLKIK
ncbi:MAG: geranylgeranylglyceryl/heptaprenylglyceryl phosphate synthase [Bacteroidales bacterium]|nr:geranylgeranylglyceryl/heptaprenylglyceryl phosphate synthase [Bacteroidales bacterium]